MLRLFFKHPQYVLKTRAYHTTCTCRMLDISLFRAGRPGGDPDRVRESQRKRFADVGLVEQVIELDEQWRKCNNVIFIVDDFVKVRSRLDTLNLYSRIVSTYVGKKKKAKESEDDETLEVPSHFLNNLDDQFSKEKQDKVLASLKIVQLVKLSKIVKHEVENTEKLVKEKEIERDSKLSLIGNLVHESVPVFNDEV